MSKQTLIDRRKMRQPDRRENANSTRIAGDRSVREPDLETGRVFVFHDDDDGYLAWLASNARGWLVDANAALGRDDLVLHRASCWTVTGSPAKGTTQITGPSWTG